MEAEALYGLLEQEVAPMFYDRGEGDLPREWINRMKASIQSLCQFFNTHRMVGEYAERFYLPVYEHFREFTSDGMQKAIDLAAWKSLVIEEWNQVEVLEISTPEFENLQVGDKFDVQAQVQLGDLKPEDVTVELYLGPVDPYGEFSNPFTIPMEIEDRGAESVYLYCAQAVANEHSGLYGYTVRVLPDHEDLVSPFIPGLITWA